MEDRESELIMCDRCEIVNDCAQVTEYADGECVCESCIEDAAAAAEDNQRVKK